MVPFSRTGEGRVEGTLVLMYLDKLAGGRYRQLGDFKAVGLPRGRDCGASMGPLSHLHHCTLSGCTKAHKWCQLMRFHWTEWRGPCSVSPLLPKALQGPTAADLPLCSQQIWPSWSSLVVTAFGLQLKTCVGSQPQDLGLMTRHPDSVVESLA